MVVTYDHESATSIGRLATDRYDFNKHIDGSDFRQKADTVDTTHTMTSLGNATNVQTALDYISGHLSGGGGGATLPIDLADPGSVTGILPIIHGGTGLGSLGGANTVLTSTGGVALWATIVNANINAAANIAVSKLGIGSAGQVIQTVGGVASWQTISFGGGATLPGGSDPQLQFNNGGTSFGGAANAIYTGGKVQLSSNLQFISSGITGDLAWTPTSTNKTLTLPNATDTIVARATTDTLTNKTINVANNTLTATSTVAGDILVSDGTKFNRQAPGSNGTFFGVAGGVVGYFAVGSGVPGGSNQQVQFNNTGVFGGAVNALYNGTNLALLTPLQFVSGGNTGNLSMTPTALRTLTLPDTTDTIVARATTDTLTNKTFNTDNNNLTANTMLSGALLKSNGSKFVSFPRGGSLQYLRTAASGVDLEWVTLSGAASSGSVNTVQTADGSGGFLGASTVLAGTGFMSLGSTPATSGIIRTPYNGGSLQTLWGVKDSISGNQSLLSFGPGNSITVGNPSMDLTLTTGAGGDGVITFLSSNSFMQIGTGTMPNVGYIQFGYNGGSVKELLVARSAGGSAVDIIGFGPGDALQFGNTTMDHTSSGVTMILNATNTGSIQKSGTEVIGWDASHINLKQYAYTSKPIRGGPSSPWGSDGDNSDASTGFSSTDITLTTNMYRHKLIAISANPPVNTGIHVNFPVPAQAEGYVKHVYFTSGDANGGYLILQLNGGFGTKCYMVGKNYTGGVFVGSSVVKARTMTIGVTQDGIVPYGWTDYTNVLFA